MTVVHLVPAMEQGGVESVVCDLNRVVAGAGWRSIVISKGGHLAERIEAARKVAHLWNIGKTIRPENGE